MKYLLKKWQPKVLINRNPTINYGSMLLMKIVDIKNDNTDQYTMSLPIQILKVLNADQSTIKVRRISNDIASSM